MTLAPQQLLLGGVQHTFAVVALRSPGRIESQVEAAKRAVAELHVGEILAHRHGEVASRQRPTRGGLRRPLKSMKRLSHS